MCTNVTLRANTIFKILDIAGRCENQCDTLWPFVVCIVFVFMFLYTPITLVPPAVFRTFDSDDKPFEVALQTMLMRLLGTIPAPIIIGNIIDQTCVVWQDFDGQRGSCYMYDNDALVRAFLVFRMFLRLIIYNL